MPNNKMGIVQKTSRKRKETVACQAKEGCQGAILCKMKGFMTLSLKLNVNIVPRFGIYPLAQLKRRSLQCGTVCWIVPLARCWICIAKTFKKVGMDSFKEPSATNCASHLLPILFLNGYFYCKAAYVTEQHLAHVGF